MPLSPAKLESLKQRGGKNTMAKKPNTKNAAKIKKADLELGKSLFQKRDNSVPGSPEEQAAVEAIAKWIFHVKN